MIIKIMHKAEVDNLENYGFNNKYLLFYIDNKNNRKLKV
jgi:hypothetical protein